MDIRIAKRSMIMRETSFHGFYALDAVIIANIAGLVNPLTVYFDCFSLPPSRKRPLPDSP